MLLYKGKNMTVELISYIAFGLFTGVFLILKYIIFK